MQAGHKLSKPRMEFCKYTNYNYQKTIFDTLACEMASHCVICRIWIQEDVILSIFLNGFNNNNNKRKVGH